MAKLIVLTGKKFGKLLVLRRAENKGKKTCWLCLCDCGNETVVAGSNLHSGNTSSCGCSYNHEFHGLRYTKLYGVWATMKNRGISQYKLIKDYHFSTGQLDRLRKNDSVSTNTLDMLCSILDCKLEEVAVYLPDEADFSN